MRKLIDVLQNVINDLMTNTFIALQNLVNNTLILSAIVDCSDDEKMTHENDEDDKDFLKISWESDIPLWRAFLNLVYSGIWLSDHLYLRIEKIVYGGFLLTDVDDSFMSKSRVFAPVFAFMRISHQRGNDVGHIWSSFGIVL